MINRILMELYDSYENNDINPLIEFAYKTFVDKIAARIFIGCTLIMFSRCNGYKPRYDATRENLLSIVSAAKEKVGEKNLLAFYIERVNTKKGIYKYLKDINNEGIISSVNIIIDYLEQFKPKFTAEMKNIIFKKINKE